MPDQIVASQFLPITLRKVGNDIPIRECERVLRWLRRIPLELMVREVR